VVFIFIVLAAGAVIARSLIRKSDSAAEQGQGTFAAIGAELIQDTPSPLKAEVTTQVSTASKGDTDKASPALWGPELDSLALLDTAAANSDAVFILLAADDQQSNQAAAKQIEAAAKKIRSGGTQISAFRLKQGAPNYAKLTKQLSAPSVLALVKGGGLIGISADKLTETKLVQAFVTASRPGSGCCPPGSSVTCE
jgi:hypothetical protein